MSPNKLSWRLIGVLHYLNTYLVATKSPTTGTTFLFLFFFSITPFLFVHAKGRFHLRKMDKKSKQNKTKNKNNNYNYEHHHFIYVFLTLADIDECVSGVHDCHWLASCTNTVGSFSCSCNHPYTGDGKTCRLAAGKYVTFTFFSFIPP